jgi:hypothetical protein
MDPLLGQWDIQPVHPVRKGKRDLEINRYLLQARRISR